MEERPSSNRVIEFADAATIDLASIDNATASTWGEAQADRYLEFLQEVIYDLADHPANGKLAAQFPGLRTYVAKIRRKRASNGHRIVYREISDGIRVIRILHTAMQWQDHIDESD